MKIEQSIVKRGYLKMSESSLMICSIVRDCEQQLNRNIPKIESLRSKFKISEVVVFENDSSDLTKNTLKKWNKISKNVNVRCEDYHVYSIPKEDKNGVNKYYSQYRISKMAQYRNKYMSFLEDCDREFDYVIIIDLDIHNFELDGIAHSFGLYANWDVITANGYSYSKHLNKRYHDTYALIEYGTENQNQTELIINDNRRKWSFLQYGMPIIPVFSAYGGLAIYRYEILRNKRYDVLSNNDDRVEVKCEHVSLHTSLQKEGINRIFINPNMVVFYEKINYKKIKNYLFDQWNK